MDARRIVILSSVLAGSVAVPPFDPARTVWIEPRPAMAPTKAQPAQPRPQR